MKDREARVGVAVCAACRYALGSLMEAEETGRCPECGHPWDRATPFVLRRPPRLVRLVWGGSGFAMVGVPVVLACMWVASRAGWAYAAMAVGFMAGVAVIAGAALGPVWVFVRGRDEMRDTLLSRATVAAAVVLTLVANVAVVSVGLKAAKRILGW